MEQGPSQEATTSSGSQEIPAFIEPESSLPYSQGRASYPYPEADQHNPRALDRFI